MSSTQNKKITKSLVFGDSPPTGSPPTTFANNTLLFEIGTGNVHQFVNGSWTQFSGPGKTETLSNKTIDQSTASGNVITGLTDASIATGANISSSKIGQITDKTKLPTDIVYTNDTKVLTNTTLDQFVLGPSIATPSNPSATYSRIYIKAIDSNNDGVFGLIKKNGAFVEVQIF